MNVIKTHRPLFCFSHIFVVTLLSPLAQANVIPYTSESAWIAALGDATIFTQTLTGESVNFPENSYGNILGNITIDIVGGVGDSGPSGLTGTGFFQGEVDAGVSSPLSLTFHIPESFGFSILGLQNDSLTNNTNLHLEEIGIAVESQQWLISDILGISAPGDALPVANAPSSAPIPFLGFISDGPLDQFHIIPGEIIRDVSGNTEEFFISGFQYSTIETVPGTNDSIPVPEPASIMLLGLGMLGLSLSRNHIGSHVSGKNRLQTV